MAVAAAPLLATAGSAAAGTAAAGAVAGGFSLMQAVSLAGTVFSAISSISAGSAESAAYKAQAAQTRLKQKREATQAEIDAERRTRSLRRTLATQSAAFAAQGASGPSSSFAAIQDETYREGMLDIEIGDLSNDINQKVLTAQSAQYKSAASSARMGGFLNAATTLANGYQRYKDRGEVPE